MRKKTKMANICRSLRTKIFFSPVLKSPTHVGFTDVKKMGRKSHTWAPLTGLSHDMELTFVDMYEYISRLNKGRG
jgi:hypothetical protein